MSTWELRKLSRKIVKIETFTKKRPSWNSENGVNTILKITNCRKTVKLRKFAGKMFNLKKLARKPLKIENVKIEKGVNKIFKLRAF